MMLHSAKCSHQGSRSIQQDAHAIFHDQQASALLAVLADGMGGHEGGQLASRIIVEAAQTQWSEGVPEDARSFFLSICAKAQKDILRLGQESGISPRSTVVLLLIRGTQADWCHIGDSRLYHFHDQQLLHRTRDHSVVQMLFDLEEINEEDMLHHLDRNRLNRSLGGDEAPNPTFGSAMMGPGDGFILCSDGFWEWVTPKEMAGVLWEKGLDRSLQRWVDEAVVRGGTAADNVTAIVVRWPSQREDQLTGPLRVVLPGLPHATKIAVQKHTLHVTLAIIVALLIGFIGGFLLGKLIITNEPPANQADHGAPAARQGNNNNTAVSQSGVPPTSGAQTTGTGQREVPSVPGANTTPEAQGTR
ncbi:PP2C family protein-serine/threonine phosphatase [Azospirillum lipoferum]|uniref:Serine/threonine phosphatase n=1 Tax=Azospirillum lipoferum (strain 4B) TaxID=862719 RepID=G7ZGE2_AZOL4|nr:protein phosphatase 2C domain-containing protein [Azospirillum lipoferum]CBS90929.1 putative serine/threonine phosphatase [Azospirillum lipoferum 4B]